MPLYEHVFMTRQDVSASQVETLTETFKTIIEENGGSVGKIEQWGLRTLQFRIRKNRKAHYTLMNLDTPPAAVKEMERQMLIHEDIIRFMTIRVEELETEPSAIMRGGRGGRDDRGPRGRGDRPGGDRPRRDDQTKPSDDNAKADTKEEAAS